MPKRKQYYIDTDRLLLYDSLDKFMFGYVWAAREILPSLKINKAIEMFKEDFLLSEDTYPLDGALQTYYRMLESYRTYRKNELGLDN